MNQRFLIGIIILTGIGSIGSVLAYSGSISAAQGNFNNVLVTGTCTGCGAEEGSFTSYNTVALNTTSTTADTKINTVKVGNDGGVLSFGDFQNRYVNLSGTTIFNQASVTTNEINAQLDQSITGEYKIIFNATGSGSLHVYKNGIFLQKLGINTSQFIAGVLTTSGFAISPDGKYIAVIGKDSGGASDRVIIFQGS